MRFVFPVPFQLFQAVVYVIQGPSFTIELDGSATRAGRPLVIVRNAFNSAN
jgi:hypothetical protein